MDKNVDYWHLRLTFINNESIRMLKHQEEKNARPKIDPADMARVRKVLFGPVAAEENSRFVEEELKRLDVIEKQRWNFDFKKEQPLSENTGCYKWCKESPKKGRLLAPKPRRPGQQKLTSYLPSKKSGDAGQKKLNLMLETIKEGEVESCN